MKLHLWKFTFPQLQRHLRELARYIAHCKLFVILLSNVATAELNIEEYVCEVF